jgi:O-antigen/teichoic acid export membrane protein
MNSRRRVALGSLAQVAIRLVGVVSGAVVAALQARTLSIDDFGVFAVSLTIVTLAVALTDLGLSSTAVHMIASDLRSQRQTLAALIVVRLALGLLATGVGFGVSWALFSPGPDRLAAALVVGTVPLAAVGAFQAIPIARLNLYRQNVLLVSQSALWLAIVLLLWWTSADLVQFAAGFAVSAAVQAVVIWAVAGRGAKPSFAGCWPRVAILVRSALPLGIGGIAVTAYYRLSSIVVFSISGAAAAAQYAAAFKVMDVLQAIPAGLLVALLPLLSGSISSDMRDRANRVWSLALRTVLAVSSLVSAGLVVASSEIVTILYGDQFAEAAPLLRVLAIAFVPICLGWLATPAIIATKHVRAYAITTWVAAGASLSALVLLVPVYGPMAAAIATVVTEIAVAAALLLLLARREGFAPHASVFGRVIVIAAIAGGAAFFVPGLGSDWLTLLSKAAVTLAVGLPLLLLTRVVTGTEARSVLGRGRPQVGEMDE